MSEAEESGGLTTTRRTLMRSTAAGAGTLATGGTLLTIGPGSAEAAPDWMDCDFLTSSGGAIIGGVAAGPGGALMGGTIGYNVGQVACPKMPDLDAEQQEADWQNWVEIYTAAKANAQHDQNQLEQARRDANGMVKAAKEDAMFAMFNEAQSGSEKATGKQAAVNAADALFDETMQGIWNHWTSRVGRWEGDALFLNGDSFKTGLSNILEFYDMFDEAVNDGDIVDASYGSVQIVPSSELSEQDVSLPSGDTISVPVDNRHSSSESRANWTLSPAKETYNLSTVDSGHPLSGDANFQYNTSYGWGTNPRIKEPDPSLYDAVDGSEVDTSDFDGSFPYVDVIAFYETMKETKKVHETTITEIENLVDANWEGAVNGTYSLAELTSSGAQLNAMQDASSFREVALSFRTQGYWMASTPTVVEMEGENGEVREYDGQLAWARENEPDPLNVGPQIDATTLAGTLYFAYNVEENGDVIGATYSVLQDTFTITAAEDGSSTIGWEQQRGPDASLSTDEILDVLRENNDAKADAEEARQDINVDTGGGFSLFGDGGLGGAAGSLIATVMIAIAALFGWNVISDDS